MINTILFDLGNTLIKYFERHEFEVLLNQGITLAKEYLYSEGFELPSDEKIWENVKAENHEAVDYSVRPLEDRLINIFEIDRSRLNSDKILELCRQLMIPVFASSSCYPDTLPILRKLKENGFKIIIVSNTAWGSPAVLWAEELKRFGIEEFIDGAVFCRDIGWRKPASQIFEFVLEKYNLYKDECIFIGDDPRWDIAGPSALGIKTVLINRSKNAALESQDMICNLYALDDYIKCGGKQ